MEQHPIKIDSLERAQKLADLLSRYHDVDFDIEHGHQIIDAKSLLGILTLDLSQELLLKIYANQHPTDEILSKIRQCVTVC